DGRGRARLFQAARLQGRVRGREAPYAARVPREPEAQFRRGLQAEIPFVAAALRAARSRYRAAEEVRARRLDPRGAQSPRAAEGSAGHAARPVRLFARKAHGAPAD